MIAYRADGGVIYSSGVVPDGTPVTSIQDPDLWLLRDCMFDAQSRPVVNFWEAANVNGFELPALQTMSLTRTRPPSRITSCSRSLTPARGILMAKPARVTLRMRIQPVGLDVLQDLVQSGDLDPAVVAKMPTFDVSLQGPLAASTGGLEWTPASNDAQFMDNTDFDQGLATCATSPGFNAGVTRLRRLGGNLHAAVDLAGQLPTQNVNVVLSVTDPDVALMYVDQIPPMKK